MMRKPHVLGSVVLLALACAPLHAVAGPITFQFGGVIEDSGGHPSFAAGDTFTGSLTFDSDLVNQTPSNPALGTYDPAPGAAPFTLTVTNAQNGAWSLNVFADYLLVWVPNLSLNETMSGFGVQFTTDGQNVGGNLQVVTPMTSVALPTIAPDLSLAQYAAVSFRTEGHNITGTVTSLTAVPDPAPTLLLLGLGLVGLTAWGKWGG